MTKKEFTNALKSKLSSLPYGEVEDRISFFCEIIDDKIEEGLTEDEAVAEIGSVDEIAEQIISEIPLTKIAKEKFKPQRRLKTWEIILLILGSPLWIPLIITAIAIILVLYVVLWSLIVSAWAIFATVSGCAAGGIFAGITIISTSQNFFGGITLIALAFVCAGLAIFAFFGCLKATTGTVVLTKKLTLGIKKLFVKKEAA